MGSIALNSSIEPPLKESSFELPAASYPSPSAAPLPQSDDELQGIARSCIDSLNSMLNTKGYSQLISLMASTSYWRDHLCLSNTKFSTLFGAEEVISFIQKRGKQCNIKSFALGDKKPEIVNVDPIGKVKCILVYIKFQNKIGNGRGILRLIQDVENGDEWRIYTMFTTLRDLTDTPFLTGSKRPFHAVPEAAGNLSWGEYHERKKHFIDQEPAVLIVGAGHSGLMTAARLSMLAVPTLVIDKQTRSGDAWRLRYEDLVLHDSCYSNAVPYLPYPPTWPVLAPKDKVADFLECYEAALDLNVWNETHIILSKWEADKKCWLVEVERCQDGKKTRRTLHPRHIVQATGLNGEPRIPEIPGVQTFEGKTMHSSSFKGGSADYKDKKVIVVGSGNSAHDISQACCKAGASVTMIQRSPTLVVSLARVHKLLSLNYNEHIPAEEADLMSLSLPSTLFRTVGADALSLLSSMDAPLIASLSAVGFRPTPPDPYLNILILTIQRAGGFYVNIGASELIASGAITVKSSPGLSISRINPHSVVLSDEEEIGNVDEIIFATGYENGRARTRKVFGDAVADGIESIWGFDGMGEIRGVWRRGGRPGFWVAAGAFWISRYYSRLLALQIKAIEMGLVEL
ncbi:hypothetical protein F5882DRAFT_320678 [Hyaloscypha sp. PMI_1271]|nr:hypothetical protein F5882DRAFT_320678 [Hyaloscypha sp. PMI_1271]